MFSKEDLKLYKANFWDEFKSIMQKHKSADGKRINWISYPSGLKDIYIRLDADKRHAFLSIDIQSKDDGVRAIIYEQFTEMRKIMLDIMEYEAEWIEHFHITNTYEISRIWWELPDVSMFKKEDKEIIFEFLKTRLIAFDEFYSEFKDIVINLVK